MGRLGFHASRFQRVTLTPQAQLQNTRRGRPETRVTRGSCAPAASHPPRHRRTGPQRCHACSMRRPRPAAEYCAQSRPETGRRAGGGRACLEL
eukprot:scaffold9221_cov118-Isochrysis_galbana.AAC.5